MRTDVDYLIIGAGPAGLQLAYFLEKNKRDYLILERASTAGAFFKAFPRHRMLISINKVYTGIDDTEANLRWDWNSLLCDKESLQFKNYSQRYFPDPDDLHRYLMDFAEAYNINVKYNTSVKKVSKIDGQFQVTDAEGNTFTGKKLVVATGLFKPYLPAIPGIELCDNYTNHNTDPEKYTDKRVLVIGKGNSAFETADNLIETASAIHICSPNSVKFAWQTHYVGNLRAVNNNFLDTYQLKSQNTVIDAQILEIERKDDQYLVHLAYSHANGQTAVVPYDHVIFCTGFAFDSTIFDENCTPELAFNDKLPAQTHEWESANVPGLYFAGTLMQACDYRKTMSGFIHGFRHNIHALSQVFEQKYHGVPWQHENLEANPEAVLKKVITRVNSAPGMFLQPGFLGDVVTVDMDAQVAKYYEDVRMSYVSNSNFSNHEHYYTISLEYGHFTGDPFSVERDPDPEMGDEAAYLHPVIRKYSFDKLVAEHHIQDDLESQWYKDIYVQPALAFFKAQIELSEETEMVPA